MDRQLKFDERNSLGFPLLSDPKGKVAKIFGVKRIGLLPPKRTTFVIAQNRQILRAIQSETNMAAHAEGALAALRALET